MADEGHLCYRIADGALCYRQSDGALIYKVAKAGATTVSFAWGTDGTDLDICAFWNGAPDMKIGWSYREESGVEYQEGVYRIVYSGDIRGSTASEWIKVWKTRWSEGLLTLEIHLNFYGYGPGSTANTCTVIASQDRGKTIFAQNVRCGTESGSKALTTHPGVRITFSATGEPLSITQI